MVQNHSFPTHLWDFTKGGMHIEESELDTLKREISEELGNKLQYKILRKSSWYCIYEWSEEKQKQSGMRGAARVSYWALHSAGEFIKLEEELRDYKWVKETEFEKVLIESDWKLEEYVGLLEDWERIKKEFGHEFTE